MDENRIIRVINLTLDPNSQKDAEKELEQMHKIIGFAPILLQLSTRSDIEFPVRHATAIYLKNLILNSWIKTTEKNFKNELWTGDNQFEIHEQDRAQVREMIVHSIVNSPLVLQSQLSLCLSHIAQHDFPLRWPQLVERIQLYLTSTTNTTHLNGALLCINKLVRLYEYRKATELKPLIEALQLLLPIVYQIMCSIVNVIGNDDSYLLQKLVLKTIFSLIHYNMPLDLLNQAVFTQWMEIFLCVIKNSLPPNAATVCDNYTAEDLDQMLPWKCKKWAAAILERIFERYGQPNDVEKPFKQFAVWYLKTFSYGILDTFIGILDTYRKGEFVGSRLIQKIIHYLTHAISHSYCWNRLKPHMSFIIQEILFPILCYSKEDHELWTSDPIEYIHLKFESFQDLRTPVSAAEGLLSTMCRKRKNMLELIMIFVSQVMNENPKDSSRQDGALHFIGVLAPVLIKKEFFTNQMDYFFETFILPEFANPAPHLRARICWICHQFNDLTFKQENMKVQLLQNITQLFLTDKELPVRIEASIAIQMILDSHDSKCIESLRQYAQLITQEALKLINETENEDVMSMLQKIFRWIDNILERKSEVEHIVFEDQDPKIGFTLTADLKWDKKTISTLYLLAIVRQKGIRSIRDLTIDHLPLLQNIKHQGCKAIEEKYGLKSNQLRIYLHYQPSFYHLHIHFTNISYDAPGIHSARAHLLQTVIDNLQLYPNYYQNATLTFSIKQNDKLYDFWQSKMTD